MNEGRSKSSHNTNDGQEGQEGHSPIVCALLRTCQIDDQVEGTLDDDDDDDDPDDANKISITSEEREASKDRITSEYESYPATLTNVLMEASCFEPVLKGIKKQKMDQSNGRQSTVLRKNDPWIPRDTNTLTIHIIGASEEAEFWGDYKLDHPSCTDVYSAYAEALSDLIAKYNGITTIHLIFIGPNCPRKNVTRKRTTIQSSDYHGMVVENNRDEPRSRNKKRKHHLAAPTCEIILESHRSEYIESLSNIAKPDLCVFFNPGFTCHDYDWPKALDRFIKKRETGGRIPFFATTNTEMEAISDLEFLYEQGYIDGLPATVKEIDNDDDALSDRDTDNVGRGNGSTNMFFGENPSSGMRVRQSGNMANDLFVKNRWIYGGLFRCGDDDDLNPDANARDVSNKSKNTKKRKSDTRSNPALL